MRSLRNARALAALLIAAAAACSDREITAPTAASDTPSVRQDRAPAALTAPSLAWNGLARDLVARRSVDPPMAARTYALLSVAQHDAVVATSDAIPGSARARKESAARVAVIAASTTILAAEFPLDADQLRARSSAELAGALAGAPDADEVNLAFSLGARAARRVLERAASDGSADQWTDAIPVGPGIWFSAANATPLRPRWGQVRPWLLRSGDELRPPPPPAWKSAEYLAALAEVRRISDSRTPEQLRVALYWADGSGTVTPPGHWNAIAADLIARHHLDEEKSTRTLALLNMALMDAGIACWDAKYHYWLIRPSQADPAIVTAVPLPNFPSYVSGHATFSGAAAQLLAAAFPEERDELRAMAVEAAMSRLYGGIHYRFDNDAGLALGRRIGARAAARL
ncbi:MAG TPA: vanadium-dependent haloperoxidase [Gemmatimonadaceae bacterium]